MAFTESWMNELIARSDIVSVISAYTELKPKGQRLWGLCPLHGEKTASFSVSPDKQLFYCFGCHAGGTVIQFIMSVERLTFPEAVRFLADKAGMEMPEEADDGRLRREHAYRERLQEACRLAARFYMETLLGPDGDVGREYLVHRGIGADIVKRFGLGLAPDAWDALQRHLTGQGYTEQELLDAGLLVKNPKSARVYDAYRNRVIFPILATNGRVIGFGARVLNSDDKPKYINTGDTPIYNKRNNLYGLYLLKGGTIADIVMVEGYMDVIGLYQAGVTNAVASLGTALTTQQARLLKRYTQTVFIAYDGDSAGQNAMIRGLDILSGEGLNVRVIVFPDGLDPDEFVRQRGREAFDALKEQALTLNAFKLTAMARGFDLAAENGREAYAKQACRLIATLQPIERDRYIAFVARQTGYTAEALKAQTEAGGPARAGAPHRRALPWKNNQSAAEGETERTRAETALLYAVSNSAEAAAAAEAGGAEALLSDEAARTLYRAVCAAYARHEAPNPASVIATMEEGEASRLRDVLREDAPPEDGARFVQDCMHRIRRYDGQARVEELTASLGDPQLTDEQRVKTLNEIQRLHKEMRGQR